MWRHATSRRYGPMPNGPICRSIIRDDSTPTTPQWRRPGSLTLNGYKTRRLGTAQNRGEQDEGDGGNIIGAILAGHDGRRSRIYHTAVHPEARGMGVGSLLAGHAVEALRALGLPKVAVGVYADNKAGNDFWEQQGFAIRDDLVYRELSL